jgi:hypothetical protein
MIIMDEHSLKILSIKFVTGQNLSEMTTEIQISEGVFIGIQVWMQD